MATNFVQKIVFTQHCDSAEHTEITFHDLGADNAQSLIWGYEVAL
jgi:hypothetical protein